MLTLSLLLFIRQIALRLQIGQFETKSLPLVNFPTVTLNLKGLLKNCSTNIRENNFVVSFGSKKSQNFSFLKFLACDGMRSTRAV